jgi:hypothetical protein
MRVRLLTSTIGVLVLAASTFAQPPAPPNRAPGDGPSEPRPAEQRPSGQPSTAPAPDRSAQPARATTQRPAEQPAAPAAETRVQPQRREGQPVNIKIEFTITDQRGGSAGIKRTLTVTVADGLNGQIRSQSEVAGVGPIPLNIDVRPDLLSDGKLRLGFNLQYDWPAPVERVDTQKPPIPAEVEMRAAPRGTVMKTTMHNSVALILESGKSMVASQSADPIGDRQVTVEVKATVLR